MTLNEFYGSKYYHDGGWELFRGELIAMSPSRVGHEFVVMRLGHLFQKVIDEFGLKCVVGGSNAAVLYENNSLVMPDLFICCDKGRYWDDGRFHVAPELVVEILSPATKTYCVGKKKELYRDCWAIEYWLVDIDEKWVQVENFEIGFVERFELDSMVRSQWCKHFRFEVRDILKNILE
jgi:Uma2 family endonuclease